MIAAALCAGWIGTAPAAVTGNSPPDSRAFAASHALPADRRAGRAIRVQTKIELAQNRRRPKDHDRARDAVRRGQALPLGEIIRRVQAACPGTFLNAKLGQRGNTLAYRVQILRPSGRRVTMTVDARTGRVIGSNCR